MDPVTHSLTGAALSRAGLHRTTPLATATLVLAANAPDIDILASVQGGYATLAFRRGVTHGPLALLLLPLIVAAGVLAWDGLWRRRKHRDAPPARVLPVLGLALIGVLTHSPLDWLNTYGIRLLMPFSERWFYGDSLFIIDPWIWLALSAAVVAAYTGSWRGQILWFMFAVAATALVLVAPQVPLAARVLWLAGVVGAAAVAIVAPRRGTEQDVRPARIALAAVSAYIIIMIAADVIASREVRAVALRNGVDVHSVMVAPMPANPLAGEVVVESADAYHLGAFNWLRRPRTSWDGVTIPKGEPGEAVLATLHLQEVRDFLRWSRFPFVQVHDAEDGYRVRFGDARYPVGMRSGLGGITVEVERSLRVRPEH